MQKILGDLLAAAAELTLFNSLTSELTAVASTEVPKMCREVAAVIFTDRRKKTVKNDVILTTPQILKGSRS